VRDNRKRETMLRDLSIGDGLGLDVKRARQDEFFYRLVERYLSEVRVLRQVLRNPAAFKLPEDCQEMLKTEILRRIADLPELDISTRRVWAKVIADFKYPPDGPVPPREDSSEKGDYLEDLKIACSRHNLYSRKERRKKRLERLESKYRAEHESGKLSVEEEAKLKMERRSIAAMKATYGDFRAGFIDAVCSRLNTVVPKPTLKTP
jgi:hypothetical protein